MALVVLLGVVVAAQAPSSRAVVIISDLHMGAGRDPSGAWLPSEDFRWSSEFAAFLAAVDAEGKSAVDLVINGDAFELEEPAGNTLEQILTAHRSELEAIRDFAGKGSNRVMFVPGDADARLAAPNVRDRLLKSIGADRVQVASDRHWVSADGRVYAEHGHQIGPDTRLRDDQPPGYAFVRGLLLLLEMQYPIVDNIAVLGAGVKYGLAATGSLNGPGSALLIRQVLLHTISWQQFRMELDDGDVDPPQWDVAPVRAQGGAFLISSLPDDDPLRPVAKALPAEQLDAEARALTDEEIVMLCDYRAAMRRSRRRFEPVVSQFAPRGPAPTECPRTPETRGAIFDYFWRSRDQVYARHIEEVRRRLPGAAPTVFAVGHTHLADRSQTGANMISGGLLKIPMEGFSPVRGAVTPVVINGGAWQRTITPVQLERALAGRALASLTPADLPPCYSFVQIPPAESAAVRYWRQDAGGAWAIAAACGR